MTIQTQVMRITPEMARDWLDKNVSNRRLSQSAVENYAKAMKANEWSLNGEALIFDSSGILVNGQHRLTACVQSGCSFDSVVVFNVSKDSFSTVDTGKTRTASDCLGIIGEKNSTYLAAAARFCVLTLAAKRTKPSNLNIIEYVAENPGLNKWADTHASLNNRILPSFVAGLAYLIEKYHGIDLAEMFFEKAAIGVGLRNDDPEFALRERFLNMKRMQHMHVDLQHALAIKAANARIKGQSVKLLRMIEGEKKPEFFTGIRTSTGETK